MKIATAIKISRKCLKIVYQNISGAIGVKLICLILGAVGIANMWLAIFCRCRCDDSGCIKCDSGIVCKETVIVKSQMISKEGGCVCVEK